MRPLYAQDKDSIKTQGKSMKLPTSQKAAIAAGSARYNTGKPCIRGHYSDRDTIAGDCLQCRTVRSAEKRKANVEALRAAKERREAADLYGAGGEL